MRFHGHIILFVLIVAACALASGNSKKGQNPGSNPGSQKIKRSPDPNDHVNEYAKARGYDHGDHSHPKFNVASPEAAAYSDHHDGDSPYAAPQKVQYHPSPQTNLYGDRHPDAEIHLGQSHKYESLASQDTYESVRRVEDTQVDCHKNYMIVTFKFSAPFNGLIYPYSKFMECHMFSGQNSKEASMTLYHGPCGQQHIEDATDPSFSAVIEHRLMVQWERDFICEDDSSIIVRCDRPDDFNKTISWKFETLQLSSTLERSKHPGPKMWMEIQRGEGPDAPPLDDKPVVIGDTLTILFTLSDDVFWFGANILSCVALDGSESERHPYGSDQLIPSVRNYLGRMSVIENECSTKLKLFSHFKKDRMTRDGHLVNLYYAHFKAFRFPTSQKIVIQCDVQVCYKNCQPLPPCSVGFQPRAAIHRRKRETVGANQSDKPADGTELDTVLLYRTIEVVTNEDNGLKEIPVKSIIKEPLQEYFQQSLTCYTSQTFFSWIAIFIAIISFLFVVLIWQYRSKSAKDKLYENSN